MIIEDGTGSGKTAKVTADNRLQVAREDDALNAVLNGDAYVLHVDGITSSADDYLLALMINGDAAERDMVVTKMEIAANDTDDNCVLEVNLGGTFTSAVANGTATTPHNQKSGCGKDAGGSYYVNDGDGDMTTETNAYVGYAHKQPLANYSAEMRVDGGWIIPYGCSISLSATKNGKYTGCIHFYFRS